jgi:hypothetical protein
MPQKYIFLDSLKHCRKFPIAEGSGINIVSGHVFKHSLKGNRR